MLMKNLLKNSIKYLKKKTELDRFLTKLVNYRKAYNQCLNHLMKWFSSRKYTLLKKINHTFYLIQVQVKLNRNNNSILPDKVNHNK